MFLLCIDVSPPLSPPLSLSPKINKIFFEKNRQGEIEDKMERRVFLSHRRRNDEKYFIICCIRFKCLTVGCIAKENIFWTEILSDTPYSFPLRYDLLILPESRIKKTMVNMVPSA